MIAKPSPEEIEITVFGPGYGEAIVAHVGDGRWLLFDTCIFKSTDRPVALEYFDRIGVTPSDQVDLVLISHWHDDHIRGATELVKQCEKAEICISSAFSETEFKRYLSGYSTAEISRLGTGVDEFMSVLNLIDEKGRRMSFGIQDKLIKEYSCNDLVHGELCQVWALSPSDFHVKQNLERLKSMTPVSEKKAGRAVADKKNNNCVVALIAIGKINIILGADLEITNDERTGWEAVMGAKKQTGRTVSFFKVPHHGSKNGHHDDLWSRVLVANVDAVATPWNRGMKLPTPADLRRLRSLTANLRLTSDPSSTHFDNGLAPRARHMLQTSSIDLKRHSRDIGVVTARRKIGGASDWKTNNWVLS